MTARPIAIVGAGMSGLSLAVALRDLGRPIVLYDAASAPPTERTFCGFEVEPHPFEAAVTHRWTTVRLDHERGPVARALGPHPYAMIPGERFVARALEQLDGVAALHFDTPVDDVTALDAEHVFDARPVPPPADALLQVFRGRFVRSERPAFDPSVATLMDFRVDQSRGAHFVYVLPTSETEALVEDTYFTDRPVDDRAFDLTLDRWLERVGPHEVIGTEGGTIPMSIAPPPPAPERVTRIGLAGGVAKPSTGYAFLFAQRHARAIAAALRDGRSPPTTVRGRRERFLDGVFLDRLRAEPTEAHALFRRLFAGNDGPRLARFMAESASAADLIGVMRSLPVAPFARQALTRLLRSSTP